MPNISFVAICLLIIVYVIKQILLAYYEIYISFVEIVINGKLNEEIERPTVRGFIVFHATWMIPTMVFLHSLLQ